MKFHTDDRVTAELHDLEVSAITLAAECSDFTNRHGASGQRGLVIYAEARAAEAAEYLREARQAETTD